MDDQKLKGFVGNLGYGPAPESDKKVKEWLSKHKRFGHLINGAWQTPSSGKYFTTINPATGEVLAEIALGNEKDVDKAMKAAKKAFSDWSRRSGYDRAKYLYAIERAIAKNARLFAVLESMDNGKTIRETRDIDIPLAIRHFTYYAGWAMLHEKEYPNLMPGGVINGIVPWNFPFLIMTWKIAPAIAAGNTIVLKPSKFTPLSALMFAELLQEEVELPPGVVNIVTGTGGKTGGAMVNHPIPWEIDFTGSTEAGRKIRKDTAGSGKRLKLELGGKSPFIVFENADIDSAIEGVVKAIFFNQGEVCCAGSRLLVEEGIKDEFIRRLKVRVNKLRGGNPLDKAMDIGAINSEDQFKAIKDLVQTGIDEGACMWQPENWLCESKKIANGYWFPPTIFTNVSPSHTIAQEEFFGPVLVCMSFRTPKEAVQLANNTRYGLGASVWSQDVNTALDVARQIKAGTVWINDHNLFDAAAPFGGYRESGYGREGGRIGTLDALKYKDSKVKSEMKKLDQERLNQIISPKPAINRTYRFLIGGKLARPDNASSFEVHSSSGELIGVVGDANRKDVRNAVEAARKAAPSWETAPAHLRAQILYFLAENLSIHSKRFADIIANQTCRMMTCTKKEVDKSIERLFEYAALCDKFEGTVSPVPARMLVNAVKEPVGVIGIKAPNEYPLLGVISSLAPAIAMGNTIVLVAGSYALSAMDLVQVLQNSDVPPGVVNILTAKDPEAITKILAEHEDVDSVWFFGSAEGIKKIEAASISNVKRTWTSNDKEMNWLESESRSLKFLNEATQVKAIWVPYGV